MREQIRFETASLKIREFTVEDDQDLYALTRQPEITDILPDWKMDEAQLGRFLPFLISQYEKFDREDVRVLLAIEHKEDRQLIGWCGVFPNDLLPVDEREVAFAISKDYRNQGYTTEAVQAVLGYMFEHSALDQVVAIVKPFNVASRKVCEKAGMEHVGLVKLADGEEYEYFKVEKR